MNVLTCDALSVIDARVGEKVWLHPYRRAPRNFDYDTRVGGGIAHRLELQYQYFSKLALG